MYLSFRIPTKIWSYDTTEFENLKINIQISKFKIIPKLHELRISFNFFLSWKWLKSIENIEP